MVALHFIRYFYPTWHFVLNDKVASQFKGARSWFYVPRYFSLTMVCAMEWNYWGTCHGKGPHDGAYLLEMNLMEGTIESKWDSTSKCSPSCFIPSKLHKFRACYLWTCLNGCQAQLYWSQGWRGEHDPWLWLIDYSWF